MGMPKLLLPFGGRTMIEASVSAALSACPRVILVTGCSGSDIAALFSAEPRVVIVGNPDWESGMFSSIICGIRGVETPRFFVSLGDMPRNSADIYLALLSAPHAEVVAPVFKGERGHPVLMGPSVRAEALLQDPAAGSMRSIIAHYPVMEVQWKDDSILSDVDTPEEYVRFTSS
jgi:molybdenum cofactor cytidylyltransferase